MIKYTGQAFANISDPIDNNQTIIPKKVNVYALLISTFWKCKQFFQLAGSTTYTLGSPRPYCHRFFRDPLAAGLLRFWSLNRQNPRSGAWSKIPKSPLMRLFFFLWLISKQKIQRKEKELTTKKNKSYVV